MRVGKEFQKKCKKASALLKNLSHESRLWILCQLIEGEKCVGDLLEASHLSQSAFSQHLSRLREEGIVATRKEGQLVFYRIVKEEVFKIISVLHTIYCE